MKKHFSTRSVRKALEKENKDDKPTEVNDKIIKQFEKYQNINKNQNTNQKKNKTKKLGNNNQYQINYQEGDNDSKNIQNKSDIGLDDDYLHDLANKKKAKLALLKLMSEFSGGKFCKEINDFYDKNHKNRNTMDFKVPSAVEVSNKNYLRQKCVDNIENKDFTKNSDKMSDRFSKASDMDFFKNKNKQLNTLKLFNKNSLSKNLQKIDEEKNEIIMKKKYTEDLSEKELINFYHIDEIEKQNNNNFVPNKKSKKMRKEEIMNFINNKNDRDDNLNVNSNNLVGSFTECNSMAKKQNTALKMQSSKRLNVKPVQISENLQGIYEGSD